MCDTAKHGLHYICNQKDRGEIHMRVLFCHGKEGSPQGTKAKMLKDNFRIPVVPTLTNSYDIKDFLDDLILVESLAHGADVLVGSSRGGALLCQAKTKARKVLIAPAWKKFSVLPCLTKNDIIIHSKADDMVPYEDSVWLANKFGCRLIECGDNHRMSDKKTLKIILQSVRGI